MNLGTWNIFRQAWQLVEMIRSGTLCRAMTGRVQSRGQSRLVQAGILVGSPMLACLDHVVDSRFLVERDAVNMLINCEELQGSSRAANGN